MASAAPAAWPATFVRLGVVIALLAGALVAFASSARAETQPCVADASTGCVTGTLRTSEGEPAAGVVLTVDGPGGTVEATTDDGGRWSAAVTESGEYTVTLDEATLPEGETLRDPASNPRTVDVTLGRSTGALFAVGAPEAGGGSEPTESATDGGSGAGATDEATEPAEGEEGAVAGESEIERGNNRVVQLLVSGLIFGLLLALASVGANLIYGTTGLSNFAHGELVTLGGVVAYASVQWWGLPLPIALVVSVLAGAAAGWLADTGIFSRLRRRGVGVTQQLIVTIGVALAMLNLYLVLFSAAPLPITSNIPERINFGLFSVAGRTLALAAIAAALLVVVTLVLRYTRVGRATRAVSDNAALAAASGINVSRIIRGVWTSAGALAALGGALMGLYLGSTRFNFGSVLLLLMFAAITLGGLGSPFGGLVGAIVIGLVVELSTLVLPNDLRYATALVILVVVLLVRPQGILGRAQRVG